MPYHEEAIISQERIQLAARAMWRLEELFDEALLVQGQLAGHVLAAQAEGRLSPMYLHKPIVSKLPGLMAAIINARTEAIEVHKGMSAVGKKLGLEVRSDDGPPSRKDDDFVWPWPFGQASVEDGQSGSVIPLPRRVG